jgi:hypothetical protein
MKAVEMTALAGMIMVLGTLVTMFLVVAKGNPMVNPGPMLLLENFDVKNKVHLVLGSLNAVTLWHVAVMGVGLAKLANVNVLRGLAWAFGLWALIRVLVIISPMGAMGM